MCVAAARDRSLATPLARAFLRRRQSHVRHELTCRRESPQVAADLRRNGDRADDADAAKRLKRLDQRRQDRLLHQLFQGRRQTRHPFRQILDGLQVIRQDALLGRIGELLRANPLQMFLRPCFSRPWAIVTQEKLAQLVSGTHRRIWRRRRRAPNRGRLRRLRRARTLRSDRRSEGSGPAFWRRGGRSSHGRPVCLAQARERRQCNQCRPFAAAGTARIRWARLRNRPSRLVHLGRAFSRLSEGEPRRRESSSTPPPACGLRRRRR